MSDGKDDRSSPLARRIRARCVSRGWSTAALARAAGISRTTADHLLSGKATHPHVQTLEKVAAAFDVPLAELSHGTSASQTSHVPTSSAAAERFDRRTNPAISLVAAEFPLLFSEWSAGDWDELYSTFGEGGALNAEGVQTAAAHINRKRDTLHQMQVLLETHLGDVTSRIIETLYRMVRPIGNVEPTPRLDSLIAEARARRR